VAREATPAKRNVYLSAEGILKIPARPYLP